MAKRYPQAILLSCEIPWNEDETLMEDCFRQEVRSTLSLGFNHLYIFGTAGEGYAVTLSQFRQIAGIFREETDHPGVFPMVGVIGMSTGQVVEKVSAAHDLGFRTFQISLPPWGAVDNEECLLFFKDVCGCFPDSRFIHYNLPRTKRVLLGPDYERLVEAVPNLAGTKNCRTDLCDIESIATHAPELQNFYGELAFPHGCLYGEASLLSSFGVLFPSKTKEFFHYGVTGQIDKLFRMQIVYQQVYNAFLAPALDREVIDGAHDKMIVRASGVDMPLRLLSPYLGFGEDVFHACKKNLVDNYPDWLV